MNYLLITLSLVILRSSAYTYLGCYADTSTRALAYGPMAYGYTQDTCSEACTDYAFFALQNGGWCCCSDSLEDATQYGTSTTCGSDGLGGGWGNDLYENGDKIYVGVSQTTDYYTAEAACENGVQLTLSGGKLATWGSAEEYAQIVSIRNSIGTDTWVGLNDFDSEGKWRFIDGDSSYCDDYDGSDCDNIPQWSTGEPNDYSNGEDACELWSNGLLNDITTSDQNAYVCEFNVKIEDYTVTQQYTPNGFNPNGFNPNYYIFEVSSKDIIYLSSILLNIILITCICYNVYTKNNKGTRYAKVNYDTESA